MDVKMKRYENFGKFIRKLLVICGIWPEGNRIQKKISSITVLFSTFLVMITVANFCFHNVGDVMLLTRGMGLAVSFFATFLKVFIFLMHHEDLVFLNEILTKRYIADLKNKDDFPDMLHHYGTFTNLMYPHFIFLTTTMVMYGLGPLISLKKSGEYKHVFPAILPIDYEAGGMIYWFVYCVEVTAALSLSFVNTGIDCLFVFYALEIADELIILGKRFKNLRFSQQDYRKNLKECITRHYLLIDSKKRFESTYGITSIWTAVSSALVLCSLMFQVTEIAKAEASYSYIVQLCCYLFPKLLQIFTYAWHGNFITEEADTCLYLIYESTWPEDGCNSKMKNDMLIVMAQKPLALLAKGCMYIQLDMFTKVIKASVSYFCILRTLNEQ